MTEEEYIKQLCSEIKALKEENAMLRRAARIPEEKKSESMEHRELGEIQSSQRENLRTYDGRRES